MNLFQGILLFLSAAIAGAINSIAGGGSFIAFPALIFTGVPPINSNAICSVALFPGSIASIGGYRLELIEERKILPLMILTSLIGGIAALIFISAGVILWLQTCVMIIGAIIGGFWGAYYARKYDPIKVRKIVIFIGSAMTLYFFARVYLFKP